MSRLRDPRWAGGAAAALLVVLWWLTGSFVTALAVTAVLGGLAGLAALAGPALRPRPPADDEGAAPVVAALATADLALVPGPAASVRRVLRGALSRPWVRGDALVRATSTRLGSPDALVFTPRGERVAAPHLWVEWNVADAAEIAGRRPLDVLAEDLLEDYVERTRGIGARRLADRTSLHLLARRDVPVGRVVVTAAFSAPQDRAVAVATTGVVPVAVPDPRPAPPRSALPTSAPPTSAPPAFSPPARPGTLLDAPVPGATLVAEGGGVRARDVALLPGRPVHLGRDPSATVALDHPGVSWRHATLRPRDPLTWTVADDGSTNGTFVDGRRISGPTPLRAGGVLALGRDGPRWRLVVAGVPGAGSDDPTRATATTPGTRRERV